MVQNFSIAKHTLPECLTIVRTVFIMKDAKKGKVASNYGSVNTNTNVKIAHWNFYREDIQSSSPEHACT